MLPAQKPAQLLTLNLKKLFHFSRMTADQTLDLAVHREHGIEVIYHRGVVVSVTTENTASSSATIDAGSEACPIGGPPLPTGDSGGGGGADSMP